MATLLLVEDDKNTQLLTAARLKPYFDIICVENGEEALTVVYKQHIDLIIADIMMPRLDGYGLVKTLRKEGSAIPIVLVTAKQSFEDKREGFSSGTDDYMTKPINYDELLWRVKALLRRAHIASERKIHIGTVTVNSMDYTVTRSGDGGSSAVGEKIELPKKEFELLYKLLSYPGKIFTRSQLLDDIWGFDSDSEEATIKTHISRLRNKFASYREFHIITIKGLGYKAEIEGAFKP
jgi:DNA-binding response OmpR family regulator